MSSVWPQQIRKQGDNDVVVSQSREGLLPTLMQEQVEGIRAESREEGFLSQNWRPMT